MCKRTQYIFLWLNFKLNTISVTLFFEIEPIVAEFLRSLCIYSIFSFSDKAFFQNHTSYVKQKDVKSSNVSFILLW